MAGESGSALPVKALLFDMGGVVLDVDFERVFAHWAMLGSLDVAEVRARFSMDEAYRRHERGEIAGSVYIDHIRELLGLPASDEDIVAGWNAIFGQEFSGVLDAIDAVRPHYPCYGFTNSNALHQVYWETAFPRIRQSFDTLFVSSELGLRKPEPAAFHHILDYAGVAAENMLFFDDSLENIDGARALHIQTVTVTRPDVVVEVLAGLPRGAG